MKQEYAYWMALAHTEKMRISRKNDVIVRCYELKMELSDFFHSNPSVWENTFALTCDEIEWLLSAKQELPNYAFIAEDLLEQGYDIIPITSPDYPKSLKTNLKKTYAPTLIYTKGNKQLLQENSIAIVGSRQAGSTSLLFTDNVAQHAAQNKQIVISGYAKGVDRQALDSTLKYQGKSIIILPQGITTFSSGFKTLYKEIINGKVLVLSTFHPKAPWNTGLAMARNVYIYGMANEIYIAESDTKGGTWAGAKDGLRKNRKIYVRQSLPEEKNANQLLIEEGAIPVSLQGEICDSSAPCIYANDSRTEYENLNDRIRKVLRGHKFSSKEIISHLDLNWSPRKMTEYLQKMEDVESSNQSPKRFTIKDFISEPTLF